MGPTKLSKLCPYYGQSLLSLVGPMR